MKTSLLPAIPALLLTLVSTPLVHANHDAVQYLADVDAIRHTLFRYPQAIDSKAYDIMEELFTPDATYSLSPAVPAVTGVAAIKNVIASASRDAKTQHFMGTEVIDLDRKRGTATSVVYLLGTFYGQGGVNRTTNAYGFFKDELVRTNSAGHYPDLQWRFKSRAFTLLLPIEAPIAAQSPAVPIASA
ncbi:MAG: hypothetical protein M1817_002253 [Caeruleum heppii]|nr:MAG: hypothetical protein M1817_002253 [Caeruleum heppii]